MQLSTRQASSAGTSTSFYPSLLGLLLLLSSSRILLLRAYCILMVLRIAQ